MTMRVLFVCLGNICRSPTAEVVFATLAQRRGLSVQVDSAGTSDWHVGEPPYPPMVAAAARRGYDLSCLRARLLCRDDFGRFDHILVMDQANLRASLALRAGQGTHPEMFLGCLSGQGLSDVPDPYYTRDFDQTIDLAETASTAWIARMLGRQPAQ